MASPTIKVKNFERFQHYKDRNPPWIKLYGELLEDYEFGALPDALKGQLLCIWLLASRTDNCIPNDAEWVGKKIGAQQPVDLKRLLELGFLQPWDATGARGKREDWPSRYIPDALREQVMENSGRKCKRCGTKKRLEIDHITPVSHGGEGIYSNLQVLCVSCNRKKRAEQMRSRVYADATQMRNPETETETETERETEKKESTVAASAAPRRTKQPKGSRLEKDWRPDEQDCEFCRGLGLDPETILAEFRDYWCAVPGSRGRKIDWGATFRNRCREVAGKRPVGRRQRPGSGGPDSLAAVESDVLEALARKRQRASGAGENNPGAGEVPAPYCEPGARRNGRADDGRNPVGGTGGVPVGRGENVIEGVAAQDARGQVVAHLGGDPGGVPVAGGTAPADVERMLVMPVFLRR